MRARCLALLASAAFAGAAAGVDIPGDQGTPATEPPYVGDPLNLTAEQRAERSLRTIQLALERGRSDRVEDQDAIVCIKQTPTGTHRSVINCATNRFWRDIRESSLSAGLAGVGGARSTGHFAVDGRATGGGGSARKDDRVFTLSLDDFAKLEKRYGKFPKADAAKP